MTVRSSIAGASLRTAEWFNPITGSPSSPLELRALFASFGPSLMPRAAMHQGMAVGASLLAANIVASAVDGTIKRFVPNSSPLAMRLGARAVATAAGLAVSKIPETADETTLKASLRSAGRLAASGAVGGMIYESGVALKDRFPARSPMRPIIGTAAGATAAMVYSKDLLTERQSVIKPWTQDDKAAALAASVGIGLAVDTVGRGIGKGFLASRREMVSYMGEGFAREQIERTINNAVWAAGGIGLHYGVVAFIATNNETIEPAYAKLLESPYVSGGPKSISPLFEVGLQGRRFLTDVMTPDVIESTLGEKEVAHPNRAFVGSTVNRCIRLVGPR